MEPPTLTREAVRELDRRAIQEFGVPSTALMESAGRACALEAARMLADGGGKTLVLVGPGNNGGDGFVIARTLDNLGHPVRVVFVGADEQLDRGSQDFLVNAQLWRAQGGELDVVSTPSADLVSQFAEAALIVDALFGTGLTRDLADPWAGVIDAANESAAPILAVDLPSGLDANTGEILGAAIRAAVTVTFVAGKPGLYRGLGPQHAGRVVVAEIGIPRFLIEAALQEQG